MSRSGKSRPDRCRISAPRYLLEPLDQALALEAGEAGDPEQAVELIDLVLVADGAQAVGLLGVHLAVDILIADPDAGVAHDLVVDPGHRDAAFAMQDRLGRRPFDLGVDISARTLPGVELEHDDP